MPNQHERVVASELEPRARAVLLALAAVLLTVGAVVHRAGQDVVVDVPMRGTADRAVRVEGGHAWPALLAGVVGGAGLAVALYAFAHPLARHKALPYLGVAGGATGLARLAAVGWTDSVDRASETLVLRVAPPAAPPALAALLAAACLAAALLGAWCLLRPLDLEGTPLWRYLGRDALRATEASP